MTKRKIDEQMVRYFMWAVWNFFTKATSTEPEVGAPYLADGLKYLDYTGVIGISGSQKGAVYVTLSKEFIEHMLVYHFDYRDIESESEEFREEIRADLTGEMANTIAGNVRSFLGGSFLVSVPIVFRSPGEAMHLQKGVPGIVFPISWGRYQCKLIVALEVTS